MGLYEPGDPNDYYTTGSLDYLGRSSSEFPWGSRAWYGALDREESELLRQSSDALIWGESSSDTSHAYYGGGDESYRTGQAGPSLGIPFYLILTAGIAFAVWRSLHP
jgi:hypothetical protein